MQRYFVPSNQWQDQTLTITDDDYHHIVNVMRMKEGQSIICSSNGMSYLCEIVQIHDKEVTCQVLEKLNENQELPITVTLAQGLPKGDKLDFIVQKATELGMKYFAPLQLDRSIVKWDHKKEQKKLERLRKIAKEASEQSHRAVVPTIHEKHTLKELFNNHSFDHCWVASELVAKEDVKHSPSFKEAIQQVKEGEHILLIVGPEGGFSDEEIHFLEELKCRSIRLGPRILRTETAPLYALSAMSFYFEEWRCEV
ncbi:16S rRNA (uracil(1498)-N(3))-methyltransferase [Piscibacillus halophilus]|uniref:Ribosomal RNA small subunit methyltransferase E n=1 Tax=Piscibacillus halophilus TaxID=571933 RepID=A0A1H9BP57_9BACI|nr:16S rRNA (uracil(1498)-N(3))-methyltransferase [Piscibacillus halophilus]SEP90323.1 16S rRNA (uracil1498-N3)-methyltransferase [Piscibacillus halophilus]